MPSMCEDLIATKRKKKQRDIYKLANNCNQL